MVSPHSLPPLRTTGAPAYVYISKYPLEVLVPDALFITGATLPPCRLTLAPSTWPWLSTATFARPCSPCSQSTPASSTPPTSPPPPRPPWSRPSPRPCTASPPRPTSPRLRGIPSSSACSLSAGETAWDRRGEEGGRWGRER